MLVSLFGFAMTECSQAEQKYFFALSRKEEEDGPFGQDQKAQAERLKPHFPLFSAELQQDKTSAERNSV